MSRASSSWLDSYLSALEVRDDREQALASAYNSYTKLADHCAALASQQQEADPVETTSTQPDSPSAAAPPPAVVPPRSILGLRTTTPPVAAPPNIPSSVSKLRADLSEAQKSKTALEKQLSNLTAQLTELKTTHGRSATSLVALNRQSAVLERRLKDRDSELREKRALLEQVQDEVVGLEMQVNVAEEEKQRLKEENASLVKRLVEVREAEVERVNRESGWSER